MSVKDLKARLLTDGDFFVRTIIENNPTAVFSNLEQSGITCNLDPDDIYRTIINLLDNQQIQAAEAILNVPINYDIMDPEMAEAIQAAAFEYQKR